MDEYVNEDNTHLKSAAYLQWAKALQLVIEKI